ncbi:MAG: hypothetical protein OSA97_19395, partial [Nevskia sp.]|nr:hypothetical protein [Nevskia sp.]
EIANEVAKSIAFEQAWQPAMRQRKVIGEAKFKKHNLGLEPNAPAIGRRRHREMFFAYFLASRK